MTGEKSALLVVDMQNDFCVPGGPLFVPGAPAIFGAVRDAVELARSKGVPVVWVVREHHPSGADTEITRAHLYHGIEATAPATSGSSSSSAAAAAAVLPPPPLALLSEGSELAGGLSPHGGEHVVSKKRFSAFYATHLASLLRRLGVTHVVVVGVQTPNCIRATAYDAVAEDFPAVSVLSDATASANETVQEANLFDMRNAGISTPTLAQWRESLGRSSGGGLFSALFGR